MSKLQSLCFVLLLSLSWSCASRKSSFSGNSDLKSISAEEAKFVREKALFLWNQRHNKKDLIASLEEWKKLAATQARDVDTLVHLARGYYLLADAHETEKDKKIATWEIGTSWGEQAMASDSHFKEAVAKGVAPEVAAQDLSNVYAGAIYWTAANLGKWAKNSGISAALKYKNRIKAYIERVEQLSADYFHSAPARYWGGFYAVAPSFAGGDMKKSKASFEKSMTNSPNYLGTKVLMAELYYTKTSEKDAFVKILNEVLNTPDDISKELMSENMLEKEKAKRLLSQVNELF